MSTDRNPFRRLEEQFERLQRQFEDALETWDVSQFGSSEIDLTTRMGVDLADHGDEFVLTADVPGFDPDEIDLRIAAETVHIEAEKESSHQAGIDEEQETLESGSESETASEREPAPGTELEDGFYIKSERARRSLRRSVRLPEPVDEERASASCNNGVLTVRIPKADPDARSGTSIDID
ncbi:Hsp20/alpha crystallin family protein [Natrarchaeobaculum aegyptiacum]|uniref:SHSP domain-containing protein n=1 Tax=Natrarchaeobaculum aegyptiacum TaxID=745377 RepID=A0A2Z2HVZ7_9EURY|nr:Hsp20/alpha crystallin family protein [Natrarchaeobaculum aegyptiacum]ARS90973.1 hypothetical protein B1756_15365 [Natrarchaeobaculum aegyptiacum]